LNTNKYTDEEIAASIRRNKGVISKVAKDLGYTRTRVHDRIKQSDFLQKQAKIVHGSGYVYLVHCEGTDYFKIGVSKRTPRRRLDSMRTGCPLEINMVHTSYCDHYSLVESILHDLYASRHVRGEWFDMTGVDIQEIVDAMETYSTAQIGLF